MARDKVGRNDPCPCGSGKKYKQCCEKTEHSLSAGAWIAIVVVAVAAVVAVVMSFTVTMPPAEVACAPGQVWSAEHGHCH